MCQRCGTAVPRPERPTAPEWKRFCSSCGGEVGPHDTSCGRCGHDLRPSDPIPDVVLDDLSRAIFYLLSIVLPFAGIVIGVGLIASRSRDYKLVGRQCIALGVVVLVVVMMLTTLVFMTL